MLCKGDHLLWNCPSIPKVLEVWSTSPHRPLSSTFGHHASDKPSTSNSKSHGKKGNVKFMSKLCEGNHPIHLCHLMDEDSKELENLTISQPNLPTRYRKLSRDPLLVDPMFDRKSSLVNPTLSKSESCKFVLEQPLFEKPVDLTPTSVNHTYLVESEPDTT